MQDQVLIRDSDQGYRSWRRLLLIAIILLGVYLRLFHLGKNSLWLDEIITQNLLTMPLLKMIGVISAYDVHPPLFYLLARLNLLILGSSDFAARFPSAFFGCLMIPSAYVIGRRLWGAPTGVILAFVVAIWPAYLRYSQEARMYALVACLVTISLYALFRAWQTNDTKIWLGYGLVTLTALYTHYSAMLFLAAQGAFVVLASLAMLAKGGRSMRREAIMRMLMFFAVCIVCALAYAPWYQVFRVQQKRLGVSTVLYTSLPAIGSACRRVLQTILKFVTEGQSRLAWLIGVGAALGILAGCVLRRWHALLLCLLCILIPLLMLSLTASPAALYPHRVFPLLTSLLLLAGGGLALIWRAAVAMSGDAQRRQWAVGVTLAVLVIASLAPSTFAYYRTEKEDWRGAGQMIMTQKSPQDIVIVDGVFYGTGDAERAAQALPYYLNDGTPILNAEPTLAASLPTDTAATGTAWGVIWYQGSLADRGDMVDTISFTDFTDLVVIRLRSPSGALWQDTASILQAMLDLQPLNETHPDLDLALAQIYLRLGDLKQAAQHLARAEKLVPEGDTRLKAALDETRDLYYLQAVRNYGALGPTVQYLDLPADRPDLWIAYSKELGSLDTEAALNVLVQMAEHAQDATLRAGILLRAGAVALRRRDYSRANDLFDHALLAQPDLAEAYLRKGFALLELGRPDDALDALMIAQKRFGRDDYWVRRWLGIALSRLNRPAEALPYFLAALDLSPDATELRFYIGDAYAKLGDQAAARQWLQDYLARDPAGPWTQEAQRLLATLTE